MAIIYISFKITRPFQAWAETFDNDQAQLNRDGITTLTRGYLLDDPTQVRIVMRAPSLAVLEANMAANSDTINDSGNVIESTVLEVFSE